MTGDWRPGSIPLWPEGQVAGGDNAEGLPRLTPFLLSGGGKRGAVLVCPGGGYRGRAAHEAEPVAKWLNEIGLHAFVLDYRVSHKGPAGPHALGADPGTLHPRPLWDVQRAIRTVRYRAAEWSVDSQRVGVLGFSAGGHLAASASTKFDGGDPKAADPIEKESSRPDAAILCYAVISFVQFGHVGSMHNLLGENPPFQARRDHSHELQVTSQTPPTFLWHTAEDGAVPVENSLQHAAALAHHGVPFALHVFPYGKHGVGLADSPERIPDQAVRAHVSTWPRLCAEWLKSMGWV